MNAKLGILLLECDSYLRLCEAGLREDMAKRIMYSILPSLTGKTQAHQTGGVIDYNVLKSAIDGRHNIIKYGTQACVEELRTYGYSGSDTLLEQKQKIYAHALEATNAGHYEDAIEYAIQAFADYTAWQEDYGGKAWEQIAKTVQEIINLDQDLSLVRRKGKGIEAEVPIMQKLIMAMNVFDGLSHNTSSIMRNLVEQESKELDPQKLDPQGSYIGRQKRFLEIQQMMDAKELQNPLDVFKQIEPTLVESGDIYRVKDWATKLREQPGYRKQTHINELASIRARKELMNPITEISKVIDSIKLFCTKSLSTSTSNTSENVVECCRLAKTKSYDLFLRIKDLMEWPSFQETASTEVQNKIKQLLATSTIARNKLHDLYAGPIDNIYELAKPVFAQLKETVEDIRTIINSI